MSPRAACPWLLALGLSPGLAQAEACLSSAETELERLYCQVVEQGGGQGLPSQSDFRRNAPQVQALLLKRPAQRLGLTLPEASGTRAASRPAPETRAQPSKPVPAPNTSAINRQKAAPTAPEPSASPSLQGCRLSGEQIRCPNWSFQLALNQPNGNLGPGVLDADNRLGLSPFNGDHSDEQAVRRYLSQAYDRYIPKMLEIGLGANTMSFTAFHNAFHTLEAGGVDFASRMEQTFQLLKQDKQTLAVQARYHQDLPRRIEQCEPVNPAVIVCDNVATNWVFVHRPR